ncbi:hypothetical protein A3J56_02310 [Candidatus Giovannonibacteria bacterium RIFCSPHIGHO2_02_FULL_46_20]|uniref:Uncharacterized protein n=1 Tax=Candidatus Giovannonibacteria bacterium RIFCSPHIGHO2_02_FULL_46_20 TaxID=1798338 RepID=A0A1F5WEI4_9BACT|nr:MAG: hypothetical protein A3J56_02310 [Candidatus Giovannonibacteria bacterium RIFCSPHIGHO2_02_FULL_46_20]
MDPVVAQENRYAAELAQARAADIARQRGNEEQQRMQALSESPAAIQPEAHKISPMQAFLLIGVALVADGLSALFTISIFLIPLYWIVWVFAVLGFFVWLHMLGISWTNAKGMRSIILLGAALGIEFMPFLNVLPAWTAFAIGTVINDRLSEFTDILEGAAKKKKEEEERKKKENKS